MQYAPIFLWRKGSGAYYQQWYSGRVLLVPGSESDVQALKKLPMTVAPESKIYADCAYTYYTIEDDMRQADLIELMIQRKSNSKRPDEPWIRFLKQYMRKGIETTFSMLRDYFSARFMQ